MLIRFTVENFKSFRETQEFSMEADASVADLPGNTVLTPAGPLVKTAAVYGHNASGKTNLVAALQAVRDVVVESQKDELRREVPGMDAFALAGEAAGKPCGFILELNLDGVGYRYRLGATAERIVFESFMVFGSNGTWLPIFARDGDEVVFAGTDEGFVPAEQRAVLSRSLNERRSLLGYAATFDTPQARAFVDWCADGLVIQRHTPEGTDEERRRTREMANEAIAQAADLRAKLLPLLTDADVGVVEIATVGEAEVPELIDHHIALISTDPEVVLDQIQLREIVEKIVHQHVSRHFSLRHRSMHDAGGTTLPWSAESAGTRRYVELLALLLLGASDPPHTFVVDELESSLSPDLLERIVRLFQHPDTNPSASQLIFTTHDRSLLDAANLLRRDQVWLAQKQDGGNTDLYSLADFPEEEVDGGLLSRRFGSGRFGGVADFGPSLESLPVAREPQVLRGFTPASPPAEEPAGATR